MQSFPNRFPPISVTRAFAGTIVYQPGARLGPRRQNDIQLLLLHSGEADIWIDDVKSSMPPMSVRLLLPGHRESFEFSRTGETWHRWIVVSCDGLTEEDSAFLHGLPDTLPIPEELNRLIDAMLALRYNFNADHDLLLRSYGLTAILLYISESQQNRTRQSMHPAVLHTKSYIERNFREDISLGDIAAAVSLSPEYLIRLFRRQENCTPIHYLWQYRLKRSLDLLVHTGLRVSEVAYQSGFKSTYHYARAVRKLTGLTPSEFRQRGWKEHL